MAADEPLEDWQEILHRRATEHLHKEGFWNRFLPVETEPRKPLTRRERLRYWRKVEAPRRLRYAWQVIRRGYHDGEDAW